MMNTDGVSKRASRSSLRQKGQSNLGSNVSFRSNIDEKSGYNHRESVADVVYQMDDNRYNIESEPNSWRNVRNNNNETETSSLKEVQPGCGCLCWRKFMTTMRGCWATRNTEDIRHNLELFAKTTLRELFTYVIFLVLLMIIAFGHTTAYIYYYTVNLKELYVSTNLASVDNVEKFWGYLETTFVDGVYWENWYNQRVNVSQRYIYFDNQLLSVPQIRQLRIDNQKCKVPPSFRSIIPDCYTYFSTNYVNTSSFGPANSTAWKYSKPEDSHTHAGIFGTYGKGGYVQVLSKQKNETVALIKQLKDNLWITKSTRVVFIDFTIYNANVNLFSVIKLVFEFPPTGGIFATHTIRTVKLIRYVDPFDYFMMACEILYMLFIVYYIVEEVIEIKKHRLSYFKGFWNILDIFVIIISFVCAGFNIYRTIYVNSRLGLALENSNKFVDFDFISFWQKKFNEAITITVFVAWVKIFKYISFNKRMSQLTDTIGHSIADLGGFVIMFFIFFFAFAQMGYLIFGPQVHGFREFDHSVFTLFRVVLGDFQFEDLVRAHSVLGPIFFLLYVFFVFFILINMFLAIINDSYMLVKESIEKAKDDFQVSTYLQRTLLDRLKNDKIVKIQSVLEKAEIMNKEQFTFQEWRNELQQHGYADVEIQALFLQYDHDHDQMLDYEERSKMLQDIKDNKLRMNDGPDSGKEGGQDIEENEDDNEEVDGVTIQDLGVRVDKVEYGLIEIVAKIDLLLEKLSNIEKAKLDHQKNVSVSLSFLNGSQGSLRK